MKNERAIEVIKNFVGINLGFLSDEEFVAMELAIKALEERPKGYWDKVNHGDYENLDIAIRCSECLEEVDEESNFCPNCGADMKGGEENG